MDEIIRPSQYIQEVMGNILSDDIAKQVDHIASVVTFPAGYTVIQEGEKAHCSYLILKGIVRGYYIDNQGNDITKCFSSEGEFFSSEGLRTGGASSFTIECLENCECIRLPYELIHQTIMQDNHLKKMINQYYYNEVGKLEKRAKNLVLMNAEERYHDFCKQYPELQSRIALQYIASYIGIRAASLSRIRKNLKKI